MLINQSKEFSYLFLLIFISINSLYSQTDCYNSNFSTGNFTEWTGYYGGFRKPYIEGIVPDLHHTIITEASFDGFTCENLLTIPPGESYSARLGNEDAKSAYEKLVYNISVSNQNSFFTYKYAAVMEYCSTTLKTQPSFNVSILNSDGKQIDPNCGAYSLASGEPYQNFQICTNIR